MKTSDLSSPSSSPSNILRLLISGSYISLQANRTLNTIALFVLLSLTVGCVSSDDKDDEDDDLNEPSALITPDIAWAGSYSVDDACYCLTGSDTQLSKNLITTTYGEISVEQVCAVIGVGPGSQGQPLYNDAQCGNGPASPNSAEKEEKCPGRVDMGSEGCEQIGPKWKVPDLEVKTENPLLNDGPLRNPLKGFHIGYFESGSLAFPNEVYFGNYMATVGYQNFNWADLEGPGVNGINGSNGTDDQWNWEKVENDLSNLAGSKQKHVIVQLNAEWDKGDTNGRTPQWFLDDPRFEQNVDELRGYQSHKYDSAFYQEEVKEFIAEFIHRFKDDPRIFIIQIGMIGYFGEFNVFPNDAEWLPESIKDMFFEHYRDHMFGEVVRDASGNLVVVTPAPTGSKAPSYNGTSALTQARYPAELTYNIPTDGIGYTNGWVNFDPIANDGFNDFDNGNTDFNDPIDTIVSDDGRKLWRLGPIGGEWPPNREPTKVPQEGVVEEWTEFWGSSAGEDYIKRGHYSFARPPQADLIKTILADATPSIEWSLVPNGWDFFDGNAQADGDNHASVGGDLFRKWHRMMGYNFQLSDIQHFFSADNATLFVSFALDNIGLAPIYVNWDVELAVFDLDNNMLGDVIPFDVDMRDWQEDNQYQVSTFGDVNVDISQGYKIGLRMVQPGATDTKAEVWALNSRNTYIVVSNDLELIEGTWETGTNKLVGGWNILTEVAATVIGD